MKEYIREQVTIVEIRHVFGCLFDDNGVVPIEDEIQIFMDMQTNIRNFVPLFQIRIIATGLKLFGRDQIAQQLELCDKARSISDMVVGYDLVCEEDYN